MRLGDMRNGDHVVHDSGLRAFVNKWDFDPLSQTVAVVLEFEGPLPSPLEQVAEVFTREAYSVALGQRNRIVELRGSINSENAAWSPARPNALTRVPRHANGPESGAQPRQ